MVEEPAQALNAGRALCQGRFEIQPIREGAANAAPLLGACCRDAAYRGADSAGGETGAEVDGGIISIGRGVVAVLWGSSG